MVFPSIGCWCLWHGALFRLFTNTNCISGRLLLEQQELLSLTKVSTLLQGKSKPKSRSKVSKLPAAWRPALSCIWSITDHKWLFRWWSLHKAACDALCCLCFIKFHKQLHSIRVIIACKWASSSSFSSFTLYRFKKKYIYWTLYFRNTTQRSRLPLTSCQLS